MLACAAMEGQTMLVCASMVCFWLSMKGIEDACMRGDVAPTHAAIDGVIDDACGARQWRTRLWMDDCVCGDGALGL